LTTDTLNTLTDSGIRLTDLNNDLKVVVSADKYYKTTW